MTQADLERLVGTFELPRDEGPTKVLSLGEAIRTLVRPGMTLHLGYSNGRCYAAKMELVRQFVGTQPGFTLVTPSLASTGTALLRTGLVKKLIAPSLGELYPSATPNPLIQRAIDAGSVEVENWSLWTYVARLVAGALGVPFFPVRSLGGSGLADEHRGRTYAEIADPFGSDARVGAVAAIRPDLTILQAVAADASGNVLMAAPYGESLWGALASRGGVIACVEKIVSTEEIRRNSALVRIPAHVVRAVCEVPLGAHPFGLHNAGYDPVPGYVEDHDFIMDVAAACRDDQAFDRWMQEWVLGTPDHAAWLAKLGPDRVHHLRGKGLADAWRAEASPAWVDAADASWLTDGERQVVLTARYMSERLRTGCFDVVLAGVGLANLAAWSAVRTAKAEGLDVELMAEIGMYGYTPRPGDPYVFANRNLHTAKALLDVMAVLGAFVSGTHNRCLGVMGCNLVDPFGNVGTTYDQQGQFLYGSGGANDIASSAAEVLLTVRQSPRRLVPALRYVTSPGRHVRALVTQLGVFERTSAEAPLRLTRVLAEPGAPVKDAVARVRAAADWRALEVADNLVAEAPPSAEELQLIRLFDPRRTLLGSRPTETAKVEA